MKRGLFVNFVILSLCMFIFLASFTTWIFWRLYHHQELLLYERVPWINTLELSLAIGLLVMAIAALALMLGFLSNWLNISDKRRRDEKETAGIYRTR